MIVSGFLKTENHLILESHYISIFKEARICFVENLTKVYVVALSLNISTKSKYDFEGPIKNWDVILKTA